MWRRTDIICLRYCELRTAPNLNVWTSANVLYWFGLNTSCRYFVRFGGLGRWEGEREGVVELQDAQHPAPAPRQRVSNGFRIEVQTNTPVFEAPHHSSLNTQYLHLIKNPIVQPAQTSHNTCTELRLTHNHVASS